MDEACQFKIQHNNSILRIGMESDGLNNFVQRTHSVVEFLAEHPHLGTIENQEKEIRGFLITKHNRLFYRETKDEIVLLNFFDTRSRAKSKIK